MCRGMQQTVEMLAVVLCLGSPLAALTLPPSEGVSTHDSTPAVVGSREPDPRPVPDEVAMVLAGTALIGAAAAVRRAA